MAIGACQIVYNPGSGNVTLTFKRGPQNFCPYYSARVHDNISTGGQKERVWEWSDLLITFDMPYLTITDAADLSAWSAFMTWALMGGTFSFSPNINLSDVYQMTTDNTEFKPVRVGPGRYKQSFTFRLVPGSTGAPGDPGQVLRRFYGDNT